MFVHFFLSGIFSDNRSTILPLPSSSKKRKRRHLCFSLSYIQIFVSVSHQTELTTRSMKRRSILVGVYGRGRSGTSRCSSPAGLCYSLPHLVQCGSDEPSWNWTQIWVQTRMPDYSLNWTTGSSAIQGWWKCQWCSFSIWSRWSFGLTFAMEH